MQMEKSVSIITHIHSAVSVSVPGCHLWSDTRISVTAHQHAAVCISIAWSKISAIITCMCLLEITSVNKVF